MESDTNQQSCITCHGYGGVSKTSNLYEKFVINCTAKKKNVKVDGTVAKNCSQYSNKNLDEGEIKCHKI